MAVSTSDGVPAPRGATQVSSEQCLIFVNQGASVRVYVNGWEVLIILVIALLVFGPMILRHARSD